VHEAGRTESDRRHGRLSGKRYLIHDRDPLFTDEFRGVLAASECLDKLVPLGERHLRRAVIAYVAHYHGERNHHAS